MKFTEIAIMVLMITLSVTALNELGIIPNAMDGNVEAYTRGDVSTYSSGYVVANGSIICGEDSQDTDIYCQIMYLNDSRYSNFKVTDTTDLFGFSDIIKGVQMLSEVLSLATYRVGDLYDYFVKDCMEYSYDPVTGQFSCIRRNMIYDMKYLFLFPVYLVYLLALFEVVTGRNIGGDK